VIRVAAVGDVHAGADSAGKLRPQLRHLRERADVLLMAGDLTRVGTRDEAEVLAAELVDVGVPVVAVLGNHDHHSDEIDGVIRALEGAGVDMLEGDTTTVEVDGARLGIAGTKGFGGGFANASGSDFGEPEMKAFMRLTHRFADELETALTSLEDVDARIALLHYAPVPDTLQGERLEIYPFLGSYLLGRAIDRAGADLVIHGHAHSGTEKGVTPGGVHVRNVALPVIRHAYRVYCVATRGEVTDADAPCEPVGVHLK
jgi:Icc-related predicted phosphoesterase